MVYLTQIAVITRDKKYTLSDHHWESRDGKCTRARGLSWKPRDGKYTLAVIVRNTGEGKSTLVAHLHWIRSVIE